MSTNPKVIELKNFQRKQMPEQETLIKELAIHLSRNTVILQTLVDVNFLIASALESGDVETMREAALGCQERYNYLNIVTS